MSLDQIAAHLSFFEQHVTNLKVHRTGHQAYGRCPFHDDKVASFSINLITSQWRCYAGCGHGNALTFSRHKGVPPPDLTGVFQTPSASRPDPLPPPSSHKDWKMDAAREPERVGAAPDLPKKIVAEYPYFYEDGTPAYQVVRFEPKGFVQRRMVDGKWIWGTQGVRRVPFRLPEILKSDALIFLVEGEKDVLRLESLHMVATTTPMGAANWTADYAPHFKGKKVVIIPDNDPPGEKYAADAARSIVAAGGSVKVVRLPGLPEHGDVSDYLDNPGNSRDSLLHHVRSAPVFGAVHHANVDPATYFTERNIPVPDGSGLFPHEFKQLCKEVYRFISENMGSNHDDRLFQKLDDADQDWTNCRTKGQYLSFLRKMKEAHEISMVGQL